MAISPKNPSATNGALHISDITAFKEQLQVGDIVNAIIHVREWTSSYTFNWIPKREDVTIIRKYPCLVETDKGTFTWNDLAYGFGRLVGHVEETEETEDASENESKEETAA